MKVLIAGYGSIGRRHFKNLSALGVDDILFYRTHKSSLDDDVLSDYIVETELDEALAHKPDAVVISNPTSLHLDVAIPAARAGCDILLEKPVSHNMERVYEFRDLVEENNVKVLMGFQFRFHPGLKKIKKWLLDERVGRVLSIRAHWGEYLPDWHPWEDYSTGYSARADLGGGVLLTLSHPLDYIYWLMGEINKGWALLGSISDLSLTGVEDTAEIGFEFVNGALGSLHLDFYQRPFSHWLEIIGTQGTLRWDYQNGAAGRYESEDSDWKDFPLRNSFQRNDLFLDEMKHFLMVVSEGVDPICPLSDGIRVQEWIEGFKTSSAAGEVFYYQ